MKDEDARLKNLSHAVVLTFLCKDRFVYWSCSIWECLSPPPSPLHLPSSGSKNEIWSQIRIFLNDLRSELLNFFSPVIRMEKTAMQKFPKANSSLASRIKSTQEKICDLPAREMGREIRERAECSNSSSKSGRIQLGQKHIIFRQLRAEGSKAKCLVCRDLIQSGDEVRDIQADQLS